MINEIVHLDFNDRVGIDKEEKYFNIKTKVVVKCHETGEIIFTKRNKLILPGAGFLARALFDLPGTEITPSYNSALSLDNTIYTTVPTGVNKTALFCVGTDGCGRENSQVEEEDYRKWINPTTGLVPFQYRPLNKDITNSARKDVYFGRKTLASYYAYYFKKFDSNPQLIQQFTDGTPIDNTIYSTTSSLPVETIVNMQMSVTPSDCRDYFIATTGVNDARINTISLCTAWYKEINGYNVYQDIRPVTKLNFPNECLIDLKKGIDIDYSVYF
jgi:hypothetical protein